jgi:hypothetical protein
MAISVIGAALDILNGCPEQGLVVADDVVFVLTEGGEEEASEA